MTTDVTFEYDESVIGVEVPIGAEEVTAEKIATFCSALGESNPIYTDPAAALAGGYTGLVAPPAILQTLRLDPAPSAKVKFGNTAFHSGMRFEVVEPVLAGDTISVSAQVKEVYAKTGRTGTMVFAVTKFTYRNQHGRTVANTESSTVHRQVER
ncbi:MAG: hypothetical protein DWI59_05815 [Chloroflexi bacterium]|nr:MAG: hypothetical protein DWI59_05815 [Chloroflexota bacterium]